MENTIKALDAIIKEAEYMKNAYFFTPDPTAHGRRTYEKYHSHDRIEWTENGHNYTAEFTVNCSCKNVYAYGTYTRDGKKTTLTAIRNSCKRLKEATACA